MVRCFDNDEIMHVVEDATKPVAVDPAGDMECIDLELIYADLDMIENRLAKLSKLFSKKMAHRWPTNEFEDVRNSVKSTL